MRKKYISLSNIDKDIIIIINIWKSWNINQKYFSFFFFVSILISFDVNILNLKIIYLFLIICIRLFLILLFNLIFFFFYSRIYVIMRYNLLLFKHQYEVVFESIVVLLSQGRVSSTKSDSTWRPEPWRTWKNCTNHRII